MTPCLDICSFAHLEWVTHLTDAFIQSDLDLWDIKASVQQET